ncbi:protein Wnt-11b-1-like [Agrilus planipennis]|uniref:Protein Wnt n=1 Tax=Agrilus planipennis TaxID=224129 RepID=A0A1W4XG37_AGRPL|nr:protein Wnt-11b-1-like [Agrilus planipennis]
MRFIVDFFIIGAYLITTTLHVSEGIRWLSMQNANIQWIKPNPMKQKIITLGTPKLDIKAPCAYARKHFGFTRLQTKICKSHLEMFPFVESAASLATKTCQQLLHNRRWNCSTVETAPTFKPDLLRATKEQAFVYALSSAALAHQIAKACASGSIQMCSCGNKPRASSPKEFRWGGCPDNVKQGVRFSKRFIEAAEKLEKKDKKKNWYKYWLDEGIELTRWNKEISSINNHNSRVGRKAIGGTLKDACKCHGMSGSCTLKTCWKTLPPLAEIGNKLLTYYDNAKEVPYDKETNNVQVSKITFAKGNQLIYLSKSPNYCTRNESLGSLGTVGRECNSTSQGLDSCHNMCCGRGYRTIREEKEEQCFCKYFHCCYVKCKTCRTVIEKQICN